MLSSIFYFVLLITLLCVAKCNTFSDKRWYQYDLCHHGENAPLAVIGQYLSQLRDDRILMVTLAGGMGNQLCGVVNGFLHALVSGEKLVLISIKNKIFDFFMDSPFINFVSQADMKKINENSSISKSFYGLQSNCLPFTFGDTIMNSIWHNITKSYSIMASCATRALLSPNHVVNNAMDPILQQLQDQTAVGLHIRSTDSEMAATQNTHRNLKLEMGHRPGCIVDEELLSNIVKLAKDFQKEHQRIIFFIASDSNSIIEKVQERLSKIGITAITTPGRIMHTSRPINVELFPDEDPYLKSVVDFFILSRVDRFYSNCDFLNCPNEKNPALIWKSLQASNLTKPSNSIILNFDPEDLIPYSHVPEGNIDKGSSHDRIICGNSFAAMIWLQRCMEDARSPVLAVIPPQILPGSD